MIANDECTLLKYLTLNFVSVLKAFRIRFSVGRSFHDYDNDDQVGVV